MNVTNDLLDDVAGQVSEYLTHYTDGQAAVTVTPSMVEGVLCDLDCTHLREVFGGSATWVASLIREAAGGPPVTPRTSERDKENSPTTYGLSVGHSCDDCQRLDITPAAIHTSGASYELAALISAGDTHDGAKRGHVSLSTDDIPAVIARLQDIHDEAVRAERDQQIPAGWPVHD